MKRQPKSLPSQSKHKTPKRRRQANDVDDEIDEEVGQPIDESYPPSAARSEMASTKAARVDTESEDRARPINKRVGAATV